MIQVWINKADAAEVAALAGKVKELTAQGKELKGLLLGLNEDLKDELEAVPADDKIAVGFIPADKKENVIASFHLSPNATNTVIIYKNKKVVANFTDVSAADFAKVAQAAKAL